MNQADNFPLIADTLASAKKAPQPRIIMVDDEPFVLEMRELIIRFWLKDAIILTFGNPQEALEELLKTDPDLLITDDKMPRLSGYDIVQSLYNRKITYPIIVASLYSPTEEWVRDFASRGLNISFLAEFNNIEMFRKLLETALKIPLVV